MDAALTNIWAAIEAREVVSGVPFASILRDGASLEAVRAFERKVGGDLPDEVVDSYLRHDGQSGASLYYAFAGSNMLSLAEAEREWASRGVASRSLFGNPADANRDRPTSMKGATLQEWWLPTWIPIFKMNKEPICVDLSPAPQGRHGQLIKVDWEGGKVQVMAPSLVAFLESVVDGLGKNGCSNA